MRDEVGRVVAAGGRDGGMERGRDTGGEIEGSRKGMRHEKAVEERWSEGGLIERERRVVGRVLGGE